jgi:hypothetical protein
MAIVRGIRDLKNLISMNLIIEYFNSKFRKKAIDSIN